MTEQEVEVLITPSLLREVFNDSIIDSNKPRYIITLGGKVIVIQGKIFYDSKEQATKAFYNSFSFKVRNTFWRDTHSADNWGWWRSEECRMLWRVFKKVVKRDFSFEIKRV